MSELDRYGMDDYDYVDETPEPGELATSFVVLVENHGVLSDRLGSRRAKEIMDTFPMVEIVAKDRGGPYIEIHLFGQAVSVINTYDYSKGMRTIPFTTEAIQPLLSEWISEDLVDYLGEFA